MLNSVILVLRELLEAALLISLLLALSHHLKLKILWSWASVVTGASLAWLAVQYYPQLSAAAQGYGAELLNIALLSGCVLMGTGLNLQLIQNDYRIPADWAYSCCFGMLCCTWMREAIEIFMYFSNFTSDASYSSWIGGGIGAGIGCSVGVILFDLFSLMPAQYFKRAFVLLTSLALAGFSMQVATDFMQMGWLNSGPAVWDSTWLLDEESLLGEFVVALLGYESKPNVLQLGFYLLTLLPVVLSCGWRFRKPVA